MLQDAGVDAVPEAHCYLTIHSARYDFTGLEQGEASPFDALLLEQRVLPEQLPAVKTALHQREIAAWAARTGLTADGGWALREACIAALAAGHDKSA